MDAKGGAGATALYVIIGIFIVGITFYAGYLTGQNKALQTQATGQVVGPTGAQQPTAPTQPQQPTRVNVSPGDHILGSPNAPVTIVEFGDYQCPFCKDFYQNTERQIVDNYVKTGKAKLAFRNFPLESIHPFAINASVAAECAGKVGGNDAFWKYHDILYTNGSGDGTGLNTTDLKAYASQIGLNTAAFDQCFSTQATLPAIQNDTAAANAAGVQGTPTFFLNGYQLVGALPYSDFSKAIDIVANITNSTG